MDTQQQQQPSFKLHIITKIALWVLAAFFAFCTFVVCSQVRKETQTATALAASPPPTPPPSDPAPPESTPLDKILDLQERGAAIAFARPYMNDSVDEVSAGAFLLAAWMNVHGTWSDVAFRSDETSVAKVRKDADAERGFGMCVRGSIVQIERVPNTHMFAGNLMSGNFNVVNFLSAGSTGELVERSRARFCGIVTGTHAFANVSGGQTQSVQMVGMFDLPENHAPGSSH